LTSTSRASLAFALLVSGVAFAFVAQARSIQDQPTEAQRYRQYLIQNGVSLDHLTLVQPSDPSPLLMDAPVTAQEAIPDVPDTEVDGEAGTGRDALRAFLTERGSPYADVDVIGYCDAAGITRHQCRLLLAICGKESNHGKAYTNTNGRPKSEGLTYHNPCGVKSASWHDYPYSGGSDGWWIAKFPSWDAFWRSFTAGQKKARFNKGTDTAQGFANSCYVARCGANRDWVNGVQSIYGKLPDLSA
jgi:hypothetical protein